MKNRRLYRIALGICAIGHLVALIYVLQDIYVESRAEVVREHLIWFSILILAPGLLCRFVVEVFKKGWPMAIYGGLALIAGIAFFIIDPLLGYYVDNIYGFDKYIWLIIIAMIIYLSSFALNITGFDNIEKLK